MKFTVSRTKSGKYSGMDHNGDLYFTDDSAVLIAKQKNAEIEWKDMLEDL